MALSDPLRDAKLKIKWAKGYILQLKSCLSDFNARKPYSFFEEFDPKTGDKLIKARIVHDVPENIEQFVSLTQTDLRSALDFLVCELAVRNKQVVDQTVEWPVAWNREEFEKPRVQKKIQKLSAAAISEIHRIEPYKGGAGSSIWALNELRRKGIHRSLTPIGHSASFLAGGGYLKAGTDGSVGFTFPTWTAPHETPTVLTIRGSDNQYNLSFTIDVSFTEIDGFDRQPILPFFQQCSDMVEGILLAFEAKFFR